MRMSQRELQKAISARANSDFQHLEQVAITDVCLHSDQARPGAVFFGLQGKQVNGGQFAERALQNGASLAVVDPSYSDLNDPRVLVVADVQDSLVTLATYWRQQVSAKVVIVAGSLGKTVAKDALAHILRQASGNTYSSPLSFNSILGVALSVLRTPPDALFAIYEVALHRPNDVARFERMLVGDGLVIARYTSRFTDAFAGTADEIDSLRLLAPKSQWQISLEGDIFGHGHEKRHRFYVESRAFAQTIVTRDSRGPIQVETHSPEIASDIALAADAALLCGADVDAILSALKHYKPTASRLEVWSTPTDTVFVRDIATTEPVAFRVGVRTASRLGTRTCIVMSRALEDFGAAQATDIASVLISESIRALIVRRQSDRRLLVKALLDADGNTDVVCIARNDKLRDFLDDWAKPGDSVLLYTDRVDTLEQAASELTTSSMPANRMYIDLESLEHNVRSFKSHIGPAVKLMAMVKALAYGTDSIGQISKYCARFGVDQLAVSSVDEGVHLRTLGISLPILILLPTPSELDKASRHGLQLCLYSPDIVDAVLSSELHRSPTEVHVEVDTGMNRTGLETGDVEGVLRRLSCQRNVRLVGMMTHFAVADDPSADAITRSQLQKLLDFKPTVNELGFNDVDFHAAATAACIRLPETWCDMVRIGLGLYGVHPGAATEGLIELQPVMSLVSKIIEISRVPAGEFVGYGASWTSREDRLIAVVPAGYHDCVPRALSNKGIVCVAGQLCPIVGRVSMDSMMIDVSNVSDVDVGSDVLIYGSFNGCAIRIEDVAAEIDTIPYEIMARVGPRVQRVVSAHRSTFTSSYAAE